jgi:putative SOS response-associated peptidase YedK
MCDRYTLHAPAGDVASFFALPAVPDLTPRYNVAPSQPVAVVGLRPDGKTRGLSMLRWGLVPWWADDPDAGPRPATAPAEAVALEPPFRDTFPYRRCLIPATGFYGWAGEDGGRAPFHVRPAGGGLLAFAGVWDAWQPRRRPTFDSPLLTCAVITCAAVEPVSTIVGRMPLILPPDRWDAWLNPSARVADLIPLLAPPPAGLLEAMKVGPAVNDVANDGPECLSPSA